jgi:hypothetical protein
VRTVLPTPVSVPAISNEFKQGLLKFDLGAIQRLAEKFLAEESPLSESLPLKFAAGLQEPLESVTHMIGFPSQIPKLRLNLTRKN